MLQIYYQIETIQHLQQTSSDGSIAKSINTIMLKMYVVEVHILSRGQRFHQRIYNVIS